MRVLATGSLLLALASCGGSSETPATPRPARSAAPEIEREPTEVAVSVERTGAAMRFDVEATACGVTEGAAVEDPERWAIEVVQDGQACQRLVNGSVEVARAPAGTTRWDTVVRFSVVYQVADGGDVTIRLEPPGEAVTEKVFPAGTAEPAAAAP